MSGPPPTAFSQLASQPSRSSATNNKPRHRHHHHPHLHRHHTKRELGHNESTLAFPSSTGVINIHSPVRDSGSREHIAGGSGEEGKDGKEQDVSMREWNKGTDEKKVVTWQEVNRAREKRKECEETLHSGLTNLSALAHTTTRRLDYTYYNLLSSIPLIRQTISSLSSLSELTTSLHSNFTTSSIPSFITSTNDQISALSSSFEEDAAGKIKTLEERMKEARERAERLGKRVEEVRARIEGWEKRSKVRGGRGRWGYGCLTILLVILLVIGLGRHGDELELIERESGGDKTEKATRLEKVQEWGNRSVKWPRLGETLEERLAGRDTGQRIEAPGSETEEKESNIVTHLQKGKDQDQDDRLRLFDEL